MREYIRVEVHFLPTAAGGRSGPVCLRGRHYMPHLQVGTAGEHLGVVFVDGPAETYPGESAIGSAGLMYEIDYSALQPGVEFRLLEGNCPVAAGRVLERWTCGEP